MADGVEITFKRGNDVILRTVWCEGMETRQCAYRRYVASTHVLALRERGYVCDTYRPIGGTIGAQQARAARLNTGASKWRANVDTFYAQRGMTDDDAYDHYRENNR